MNDVVLAEMVTMRDIEEFTVWTFENLLALKLRMAVAAQNGTIQARVRVPEDLAAEDMEEFLVGLAEFFEGSAAAIRSDLEAKRGESDAGA